MAWPYNSSFVIYKFITIYNHTIYQHKITSGCWKGEPSLTLAIKSGILKNRKMYGKLKMWGKISERVYCSYQCPSYGLHQGLCGIAAEYGTREYYERPDIKMNLQAGL